MAGKQPKDTDWRMREADNSRRMTVRSAGMIAFGPVPSRRLGRSLGINNIPAKTCTYSCVYCQLGGTTNMTIERRAFHEPGKVLQDVRRKVDEAKGRKGRIDYLSFVPDGEPTLELNLGRQISILKQVGIPIAVLTNASMIWQEAVREDLLGADLVSLKVDALSEDLWRRIDRPHRNLRLEIVLDGIRDFSREFKGTIITETMLIDGINYADEFERMAEFLGDLKRLDKAYVAAPSRPPTEGWVRPAKDEVMNPAFQVFSQRLGSNRVEWLTGYEGSGFTATGDVGEDLLSIVAVHPIREEALEEFVRGAGADWRIVEELLQKGRLKKLTYRGNTYFMRKLPAEDPKRGNS